MSADLVTEGVYVCVSGGWRMEGEGMYVLVEGKVVEGGGGKVCVCFSGGWR